MGNLGVLVLDEAQRLPETARIVKGWYDSKVQTRILLLGSPFELFFWRSRTQAEVDLVVKAKDGLRAFETKWKPRRAGSAAFRSAYGVIVEPIGPDRPFVTEIPNEEFV